MAKKAGRKAVSAPEVRAGKASLKAIAKQKEIATGPVWKALHVAEGQIQSALGRVDFSQKVKAGKKKAKKKAPKKKKE